ncbi:MAG: hypothetical protein M1509_05735 [Nitrospirae bacterium]|nr:hypothetical protein [Nitrospirota bacterium]
MDRFLKTSRSAPLRLLLPLLALVLLPACQEVHIPSHATECSPPVIILPPFAIAELSHHDAQYFSGMPYLFSRGYYRAAREILKARASHPEISQDLRNRLLFAEALADLHLGASGRREGATLLSGLDTPKTPYEIREASQRLLDQTRRNAQLRRENNELRQKLSQVKKTLKEFSNLEKSLK